MIGQSTMRAMLLAAAGRPLEEVDRPVPTPGTGQVLIKVRACAVCRTDLHIVDGDLREPKLPLVLGHEIVGDIVATGKQATRFQIGERVGVPWMGWTCGRCRYCSSGRENLCRRARFTGYTVDGGFAEYTLADERYTFPVSSSSRVEEVAPLLCAGLIGYRSFVKVGDAQRIGIYGFGSAASIVTQVAIFRGREVFAFTRPGDTDAQEFARKLGAAWAGDSDQNPPDPLEAAIIFAPVGELIPRALQAVEPGGTVVCGGIHMSDIPSFPYSILWEERTLCSVANLTRRDGREFLELAAQIPIRPHVEIFPLRAANEALEALRSGRLGGTAVLSMGVSA